MAKKEIDGVEVNGKSIVTSLKIIQQVCRDNQETKGSYCPFNTCNDYNVGCDGSCGITDLEPDNWKVLEYKQFQALE